MENTTVRIQQVQLVNIKNVEKGTITFPNHVRSDNKIHRSEIIGIYGQNGSGKTALVDAMWILKHIMSGNELPKNTGDFIFSQSEKACIKIVFEVSTPANKSIAYYEIHIERIEENKAQIIKENLSFKELIDGVWTKKAGIIDYDISYEEVFRPAKNFKLLTSNNSEVHINLGVAKKLSEKDFTSFIFSNETETIINNCKEFDKYTKLIKGLKHYAKINLFIFSNNHSGIINLNLMIPLSFRLKDDKKTTQGDLGIGLLKPSVVKKEVYELVSKVINQMNIVLETIIPGLNIGVENYGKQLTKDGEEGIRIELVSIRDKVKVPLKYESDGIKKFISILSTLITMFNNPSVCMVVDELDAGIFEYLLGEILQIINENGKGQLIFTSHNLRPLEMLDTASIIFTTTNPTNRYMRFTNVKSNNNLRNVYIRSINLGGQKEEIYKETNSFDISRAFRIAGRLIDEN
ncbi:MAG: ATP-binding protein [Anaeromicrobium sp.]|jgi:AAA15 family ATPase/GTPase|uniref:AAA family ATPase n=1 Tax=Anaeromicrobium sp. TaxID=1929132 RepID=UPI0025EC25B0|nr:AAA family ATPase [Anaeromicrobium sp.]MCT4592795.1 ATP-binding protein [Anaeromicrobium sp.]